MKKFCVFSGFLGSGKTTTMMALTKYYTEHYGKTAMISNDLGHGVNLADNRLAQLSGCNASEMTEDCICYQNENLAERINSYYEDGCELVISDIPGFGVGALEHVYHGLSEKYPGVYSLAPFTVLIEPETVELMRRGEGGDLRYILDTQLVEADLIVLNKCDTIDSKTADSEKTWLMKNYPLAPVVCISALTGDGLEELSMALKDSCAAMRRPDIGYGGAEFMKAMGGISEYYLQYHAVVCCDSFDGNAYLTDIADTVRGKLAGTGCEIPHLKLLAWEPEGDFGKVDFIGSARETVLTRSFTKPCTELAVILNASAVCPEEKLRELIAGTAVSVSADYQLETMIFKEECFGMC